MLPATKTSQDNLISTDELAHILGVSKQAILKKPQIEKYVYGKFSFGGRPKIFFHSEILTLFGLKPQDVVTHNRKVRADKNVPRVLPENLELAIVERAKQIYLSQGNRNYILNAVRYASSELWDNGYSEYFDSVNKLVEYIYKRRIKGKSKTFIGYADRYPTWETQWERIWKKADIALKKTAVKQYKLIDLLEDCKLIREGYGAATLWVIDDHKGDSFIYSESEKAYKGKLPNATYLMDALTGKFLDFIVGEPTTLAVATLIIRNALRYGLPLAISLENSRAMKNIKLDNLINALYPDDMLKIYRENNGDWFHELFPNRTSPIVRNIPHIPDSILKARIERMFREFREHDGAYFPETYQAGGIDPVQLKISTTPKQPIQLYSEYNYYASLKNWLDTAYCEKIRYKMFDRFFQKTGLQPTIANVWQYYGGCSNPGTGITIDETKFAYALYWLAKIDDNGSIIMRSAKAIDGGRVRCQVGGRDYLFVNSRLAAFSGHKLQIIFIPKAFGDKYSLVDNVAIFAEKSKGVEFICIAEDVMVRDLASLKRANNQVNLTRALLKANETPANIEVNRPIDYNEPKPQIQIEPKKIENINGIADELQDLINL